MAADWLLTHQPCPWCGSKDALSVNTDGWGTCFSCQHRDKMPEYDLADAGAAPATGRPAAPPTADCGLITDLDIIALGSRQLTRETCAKFGYGLGTFKGDVVQVAPYVRDGRVIAQKLRTANKKFVMLGSGKDLPLFGQNLWPATGKMVVVTEGEIDAMSVSQVQDNKWPVVSLPNGASSAAKALAHAGEWLAGFERVILMFDEDEAGRQALEVAAEVLPPGKAYIARLPLKDANECLKAGKGEEIRRAIWNASPYRPDAILAGSDLLSRILDYKEPPGIELPWQGLQASTRGIRLAELITIVAGTGSGKSTLIRALAHYLVKAGEPVGILALEEDPTRTALGIVGYEMGRDLHVSCAGVDQAELTTAFAATVGRPGVYLYDHFGSTGVDNVVNKIRFMAKAGGCRWVILDHLSVVVSGLEIADERKAIDVAMTRLRMLVQETGIGLILVNHLKRGDGKSAENGGEISLSDIRGSQAIAQLSDAVWALERDQQADNAIVRNLTTLRVLKNRFTGRTGKACKFLFDPDTGRLAEVPLDYGEDAKSTFTDEFTGKAEDDDIPF